METQANSNMYWIEDAEQQMPSLMPIDDEGNTLSSKQLEDISSPEQICNAVFEAIKIPGSDVLANPEKAIKALRSAIKVIKNPIHAKRKTGAFLTALAVILNACQPGNVLSRTSVGKDAAAKYSSVDDLASASSSEIDSIVGAAEAVSSSSGSDSIEKKPKYVPFTISMGDIANPGSIWHTVSGHNLIETIVSTYAKYGMSASFNNIRVNVSIVPYGKIKELCMDPETGDTLNTEYACTVNPRSTVAHVDTLVKELYSGTRDSVMASNKKQPKINCIDDSALEFNVYISDSLPHVQQKELLVHELKHCLHLYAYAQKVVSMYVRGCKFAVINRFVSEMNHGDIDTIGVSLGKLLDAHEQFDPDTVFSSSFDMMKAVMKTKLRPYVR